MLGVLLMLSALIIAITLWGKSVSFTLERERNSFGKNKQNGSGYTVNNHHQHSSWLN